MSDAEVMCRRLFGEMIANWQAMPADVRAEKIDLYRRAYRLIPWWRRLWLQWNWFASGSDVATILDNGAACVTRTCPDCDKAGPDNPTVESRSAQPGKLTAGQSGQHP